jgi:hypothetical protein
VEASADKIATDMQETPAPTFTIRQNDLADLASQKRIGDYPVAVRSAREVLGGGFADQSKHPNTWTVYFLVDDQWALVESARGLRREWASLDRLEKWLRGMGFRFFYVRNDIDPVEMEWDGPLGGPAMK